VSIYYPNDDRAYIGTIEELEPDMDSGLKLYLIGGRSSLQLEITATPCRCFSGPLWYRHCCQDLKSDRAGYDRGEKTCPSLRHRPEPPCGDRANQNRESNGTWTEGEAGKRPSAGSGAAASGSLFGLEPDSDRIVYL
jgi:hypothetical protein